MKSGAATGRKDDLRRLEYPDVPRRSGPGEQGSGAPPPRAGHRRWRARREAIQPADALLGLVDAVLPIELEDVQRGRDLLTTAGIQARDAIHLAVMQRHGIARALTFDRAFDRVPGITRIG